MALIALGMNHKTAGVEVREKLALQQPLTLLTMTEITNTARVSGVVMLFTCNRTELYVEARSWRALLIWLSKRLELDISELKKYTYVYFDLDAVRHLMGVASGLDSMVIGEAEILGQLKAAYQLSLQHGYVSKGLGRLFESAFAVAKKVRTRTDIGLNPISVAYLAVRLAARIFTHIGEKTVLLIGSGDTARLVLKHFAGAGVRRFVLANRTMAHAQAIAADITGSAVVELISLSMLPDFLARADIIVTATSAPLPIVGKGMVEKALSERKYRAMFMIDLAVPRNIEREVRKISDVYLYGIDDLQAIAAEHVQSRSVAAQQAESIIAHEAQKYMEWLDNQRSIPLIQEFRRLGVMHRDAALQAAMRQLENGKDPKQVLERFAHVLLNKLMHMPTVQMRKTSKDILSEV